MRYRFALTLAAAPLCAAAAHAQSFNIDFNNASGLGAGVPATAFPGAAQQPGVWNAVNMSGATNVSLVDLAGNPTSVTLTKPSAGAMAAVTTGATGDNAKLFDDGILLTDAQGGFMTFTVNNLTPGYYLLYTYGFDTGTGPASIVDNHGSYGINIQRADGKVLNNDLLPGTAYAVHGTVILPSTSIVLHLRRDTLMDPFAKAGVSGIQIRKMATNERMRLHVNKTPSLPQTGAAWTSAFNDLQPALSVAQRAGGAFFEVWTKQGIYRTTSGADRTATFTIPSGLRLFGGFSGSESTLAERTNPAFFITAMSGSIGASTSNDNAYTVVTASDTGTSTLIDGFTISNGYNNSSGASGGQGAGVKAINGSLTFRNTKFLSNVAVNEGGAIYSSGGAPKLVNCLVFNNDSSNSQGGGIYHKGGGRLGLFNVQLIGNHAAGDGGALALSDSPADIHNCLFSGNTSSFNAGALYCTGEAADPDIRFSTFSGNACSNGTGGIGMNSGADLSLMSSILWGNSGMFGTTTEQQQMSLNAGSGSNYDMSHTTVQGLSSYSGFKCNGANPLFVDPDGPDNTLGTTDDNCRLQPGSAAIDAGSVSELPTDLGDVNDNNNTIEILPVDLDKKLRRVESAAHANTNGSGSVPFVDRGAYEFVPACPGDTNGDAMVNFTDLNAVLSTFGQTGFGLIGDVNNDQVVNFMDLNIVLSNFGINC